MVTLRESWESNADSWLRWARTPGHDSYWRFHRDHFFDLLPEPGHLTVDIGAGEGRVGRDMVAAGHRVVAVDASPTLVAACATHHRPLPIALGDAAALPLRSGIADLVVAFMSLQDIDDLDAAIAEATRLLMAGGRFCLAVVHPLNSAGAFEGSGPESPFVIGGSYVDTFFYRDDVERDGMAMSFHSLHRSLETLSRALEAQGLLIEAIREVHVDDPADKWSRLPYFLHLRARKS